MTAAHTERRHVVYWDIDGTLLTTARAGVPALEDGAERVVGRRPDLSGLRTSGLTDRMIARLVLREMGHPGGPAAEDLMLTTYAAALPARLREKRGRVLPGVAQTLADLAADPTVGNALLTGNVRAGAEAKLRAYGLWQHFTVGGFAEDGHERPEIARTAMARARAAFGPSAADGVLVGDTPYDIAAGHEVGLRVVAVASPVHSADELADHRPWWVVDRVPPAAELLHRAWAA